jgi:hypothetical protein
MPQRYGFSLLRRLVGGLMVAKPTQLKPRWGFAKMTPQGIQAFLGILCVPMKTTTPTPPEPGGENGGAVPKGLACRIREAFLILNLSMQDPLLRPTGKA